MLMAVPLIVVIKCIVYVGIVVAVAWCTRSSVGMVGRCGRYGRGCLRYGRAIGTLGLQQSATEVRKKTPNERTHEQTKHERKYETLQRTGGRRGRHLHANTKYHSTGGTSITGGPSK